MRFANFKARRVGMTKYNKGLNEEAPTTSVSNDGVAKRDKHLGQKEKDPKKRLKFKDFEKWLSSLPQSSEQ